MLLNPNCSELVLRLKGFTREQILSELKKIVIIEVDLEDEWPQLADRDNPNIPDFTSNAFLEILEDLEYSGLYIEAGFHADPQIYPTMYKIVEHFKKSFPNFTEEWIAQDGGWLGLYEEWIEKGRPEIKDMQSIEGKILRKRLYHFK